MSLFHRHQVPAVDPVEGRRRVEAGALLLDVREAGEWLAGHAAGATWIPMGELQGRVGELPAGRPIVVICRSGNRSARVTEALVGAGHDAVNLAGGSRAWVANGLPFETDDGRPATVA